MSLNIFYLYYSVLFSACEWEWGEYGECSETCGEATRTRYPILTKLAGPGGYCPPHVINEEPQTEYCELNPCPG